MDEQEIEEILRTFDKAPSPSSENSVQSHFSAIGAFMTETLRDIAQIKIVTRIEMSKTPSEYRKSYL